MREPEERRLAVWLVLAGLGFMVAGALIVACQVELAWPEPAPARDCPCCKDAGGKCLCPRCEEECMKE